MAENKKDNLVSDPRQQMSAGLEQKLITDFLKEHGLTLAELKQLPPEEARKLRIEASKYATARLAELEARAGFINTIHDATKSAIS